MQKIDSSELKRIITGRTEPHVYSFITNTLPNYLKVGDTYRPVEERLEEWRKYYSDLKEVSRHSASINGEVFFRDFSVHKYLIQKGITQVEYDPSKNIHSKEFFEGAQKSDVSEAVSDIVNKYKKSNSYQYYLNTKDIYEHHYERSHSFAPRQNQQVVIDAFKKAVDAGRTNLLMYAVMRFGKSITSLWSAKSINSKLTVIVSAKADVKSEWKYTVESHYDFKGYRFLDVSNLKKITNLSGLYNKKFKTASGEETCTNLVLFFTLQDLAGSTETIKKHHKILKDTLVNLLIIDETHFGARAEVLGKLLAGIPVDEEDKKLLKVSQDDEEKLGPLDKLEAINAQIKLHLSGTPYRILMGSEFDKEDIIAFVQFSDIYEAKLKWNSENLEKNEWDNPYYGFPQMIRFAFNPNESSRRKLSELPGSKPADLFVPRSIKKEEGYQTFTHETEVIDLLQVLDGSKSDSHLLSILNHPSIKAGKLAQHIVFVLPYRASCDAFEKLLKRNKKLFKNLKEYTIFNLSGYDAKLNEVEDIKSSIARAAKKGQRTVTLTVNKMLTGSTVPQWDTMIYLKSTASPQEYDQAIFRLQSPWVEKYQDANKDVIKYDMKPQTLLVDLDPTRLFYLQERKAFVFGANTQSIGNENIVRNIERELKVSPIIALNAEQNKLVEINATSIIDEVRRYSNERTIVEDVSEIGIDLTLKNNQDIYAIISKLAELGGKNGLNIKPVQEEGSDYETGPEANEENIADTESATPLTNVESNVDVSAFEKRFRTYYVMILLFAFLSNTEEKSLSDVIKNIDINRDNQRIAANLGLNKNHLELIRSNIHPYVLSTLDYKIQNTDYRASDSSISPTQHVEVAINKFGRLSDSEVFTPERIVNLMYDSFDTEFWKNAKDAKILDIASKSGNFARGFVEKALQNGEKIENIKDNFYSIPTSRAAYEFTRKMYEALGLNIHNIAQHFTSYDLINCQAESLQSLLGKGKKLSEIKLEDLKKSAKIELSDSNTIMKFTAVVGNPPYQLNNSLRNRDDSIYNYFYDECFKLSDMVSLVTPARFLFNVGSTPGKWNKKMLNDNHFKVLFYERDSSKVFPNTDIKGGVVITLRNTNENFGSIGSFTSLPELGPILKKVGAKNTQPPFGSLMFVQSKFNLEKLLKDHPNVKGKLGGGGIERRLVSSVFEVLPEIFSEDGIENDKYFKIYGRKEGERVYKFIKSDYIEQTGNIFGYKIFIPAANGSGEFGETLSNPITAKPKTGHTQTFISVGNFKTAYEAKALLKYVKGKFARAMLSSLKTTQNNKTKEVWKNIPLQNFTNESDIDWSKSIAEIDQQLYKKYGLNKKEIDFIETNVKPMS